MKLIKILVTGARGFIGKNITHNLLENNQVVALLKPNSKLGFYHKNLSEYHYDYDLIDLIDLFRIENFDLVIHLASYYPNKHTNEDVDKILNSNLKLGTHLLQAASTTQTRKFINTLSHSQYYHNDSYNPVNLYAASKEAFTKLIDFYSDNYNIDVINLLLYETFGENDHRNKVLNLLRESISSKEVVNLSPGNQLLNFVHIDDVVEAYLVAIRLLFNSTMDRKNDYGVNSDQQVKIVEIIKYFNLEEFVKIGGVPYRDREVMYPSYPFQKLPGWYPKRSLFERLESFFDI